MSDKIVVKAENYSYWYPQCQDPALCDLNFEVKEGELVLLAGRSGCGKSTLAYCLMAIRPGMLLGRMEGSLFVNGQSLKDLPLHKNASNINIVFQSPDDQITNLTVEDEIVFGLENHQKPRSLMQNKLEEVLDICHLQKLRYRHVWDLSGGEKQRVAMASIIALEPPILLLDEPTSNLDPLGEQEVWEAVERIRKEYNPTIILVQHNIDSVLCKVDRVLMIDNGTVCFDGSSLDLVSCYRWKLRNEMGMWLPQATEIGLYIEEKGINLSSIPVGVDEAKSILDDYCQCRQQRHQYRHQHRHHQGQDVVKDHEKNFVSVQELSAEKSQQNVANSHIPGKVSAPWLEVEDLHFSYNKQVGEVLKGISFTVSKGENLVILGPNGAGKSTLAMELIGLLKPTSGRIRINGEDTTHKSPAELAHQIAYVFQYPEHQFICNTVHDEMCHGPLAIGMEAETVATKAEEMLRRINLWQQKEQHPFNLSMGQKRRLSVACMLVMNPHAIILDEPTFGQDWINATELMEYLDDLNHHGTTTMIITHNMRLVAQYAQRAIVLVNGQVVFDQGPYELFNDKKILAEASLIPPPIFEIADRLNIHKSLRVADFCDELISNYGDT